MVYDPAWWHFDNLPKRMPQWGQAGQGTSEFDLMDHHVDLGCGALKKGRLGIDRFWTPGVDLLMDLERMAINPEPVAKVEREELQVRGRGTMMIGEHPKALPFPDRSIRSIITHHFVEHLTSAGFLRLMDECHRVLEPDGVLRIITPLFPSHAAVADPDHKMYFCEGTFETFCGDAQGGHWMESFSHPYTNCRFEMVDKDMSPKTAFPEQWTDQDAREIRVALRKRRLPFGPQNEKED